MNLMMDFTKLNYSVEEGVAYINLDNPKNLNAFDVPMEDDLIKALELCEESEEVKVVVLSGEGKGFSAGGDVGTFYRLLKEGNIDLTDMIKKIGQISVKIKKMGKPVISSVHGPVAGAGFNIAMAADFCYAADNALFIQAFVKLGLIPDSGGQYLLNRIIGVTKATELVMTGRPVKADEALAIGLVNKVIPAEELKEETKKLAKKLANGPSLAYAAMKDLSYESSYKDYEKYLEKEVFHQTNCAKTQDFKEGAYAFVEKRKANFQGK